MCFNTSSKQQTQATQTTTVTDYGAIQTAEKIIGRSQELVMAGAMTPEQTIKTILVIGGVFVCIAIVTTSKG